MAYIVMDTETTGLKPGYIAQLACIRVEGKQATGFNAWFKVKEMDDKAAEANGLSVALCDELSGGRDFYDRLDDILAVFDGVTDVYGYNTNFDRLFLETEFRRCSLEFPHVAFQDVMPNVKKAMGVSKGFKLANAVVFFGVQDLVTPFAEKVFGTVESLHDARFDAAATLIVARKLNMI